ncbi:MAG: hypothetical protein ACREMN_08080 [Gemmatimonadales bacterium]
MLTLLAVLTFQAPLFQADTPLVFSLETDLRTLLRDRGDERVEHDAILRLASGDTLDVELRTRGIFRLKQCSFPPLRLDVPRSRAGGTPFAGQDKLKLVTHCRGDRSSERNLLREYAVYRAYNAITDSSFRARLARVTYIDTARADTVTRYAIVLEADEELARRLGAEVVDSDVLHDVLMQPEQMTTAAMFQYLIGNTDWSVWKRHNIEILRDTARGGGALLAIPYDFDFSGAVSASYARPPAQLPIRSVRDRLYRGFCQPDSLVLRVIERFRARKDAVYAAVSAVPWPEPDDARELLDYFDGFYRAIEDEGRVRREFLRGCRQPPQ